MGFRKIIKRLRTVFSTLKKGCIPETSVFFSKPFLTLFDIYFYINPIRVLTFPLRNIPKLAACARLVAALRTATLRIFSGDGEVRSNHIEAVVLSAGRLVTF